MELPMNKIPSLFQFRLFFDVLTLNNIFENLFAYWNRSLDNSIFQFRSLKFHVENIKYLAPITFPVTGISKSLYFYYECNDEQCCDSVLEEQHLLFLLAEFVTICQFLLIYYMVFDYFFLSIFHRKNLE